MKQLHFLIGASGCGKTHWWKSLVEQPYKPLQLNNENYSVLNKMPDVFSERLFSKDFVFVDGCVHTIDELKSVIRFVLERNIPCKHIFIHCWKHDENICAFNNIGRQLLSSQNSDLEVQATDFTEFQCYSIPIEIQHHKSRKKSEWLKIPIPDSINLQDDRYLSSDWWPVDDATSVAYPIFNKKSNENVNFDSFLKILELMGINDMTEVYRIMDSVVRIETKKDSEYEIVCDNRNGNPIYKSSIIARYVLDLMDFRRYLLKNNI